MSAVLIVVIAASALVVLSLLMLAAFCLFRQRRKDLEDELGSLEDRSWPVKRIQSNLQLQRHRRNGTGTEWPSASPIVRGPKHTILLDTTDALVPGVSLLATTTPENSSSIYSTESAPLHFHDQLSNPLFVNRVVMSSIARANLPRGMNLPSSVTRDLGLFMTTIPESDTGTGNLPLNFNTVRLNTYARASARTTDFRFESGTNPHVPPISHSARSKTLVPQLPHPARSPYLRINPQTLRKTISTSSFPPPLW